MTFPIKKRINTQLFIDRKRGLYIQIGIKVHGDVKDINPVYDAETE